MTDEGVAELYMAFGGIPYYWSFLERGKGVAQNLDDLCFSANGKLRHEFDEIFAAFFGESPGYLKIVQTLAKHVGGMTFAELLSETGLSMGGRCAAVD